MIEELKLERDQAVVERNQALSALMEMEKKHSDALERIEQLKKLCSETRRTSSNEDSPSHKKKWTSSWLNRPLEQNQEDISEKSPGSSGSTPSALDPYGINLFQKCAKCQEKDGVIKTYEKIKEERDQIWRDIVKQAHQERDEAVRKLETVRRERDHYLERMGKLEKVNKQLSSAAKKTQGVQASNTAQSRHDTVTVGDLMTIHCIITVHSMVMHGTLYSHGTQYGHGTLHTHGTQYNHGTQCGHGTLHTRGTQYNHGTHCGHGTLHTHGT